MKAPTNLKSIDASSWAIALLIGAISLWYLALGYALEHYAPALPYFVTEWMITFSAGFVRRGVLGQTFWSLGTLLHTPPLLLIQCTRVGIAAIYLSILGKLCFARRKTLGLLGVLVILSNPLVNFYTWFSMGALDLLFLLITVANLKLAQSKEGYLPRAVVLFATVGVFLVLSHEAFLFLGLPINVVISYRTLRNGWTKSLEFTSLSRLGLIYAAPVIACLVAAAYHGTPNQAAIIAHEWTSRGVTLPYLSAIEWLKENLSYELRYVSKMATAGSVLSWFISASICILPLALLWVQLFKSAASDNKARLKALTIDYVGFPLLASVPLYFIGTDWHRWIALPFATGTVCLLMRAPIDHLLRADRRMKFYLGGLVFLSLFHSPTALYFSQKTAPNGPLMGTNSVVMSYLARHRCDPGSSRLR